MAQVLSWLGGRGSIPFPSHHVFWDSSDVLGLGDFVVHKTDEVLALSGLTPSCRAGTREKSERRD